MREFGAGSGRRAVQGGRIIRVGAVLYAEVAMSALLLDYLPLVVFVAVALVIGLALLIAPFLVAYQQPDPEKLSGAAPFRGLCTSAWAGSTVPTSRSISTICSLLVPRSLGENSA